MNDPKCDPQFDELRQRQKFAVRLAVVLTIQFLLHLLILLSRAHAQQVIAPKAPGVHSVHRAHHANDVRPLTVEDFPEFAAAIPVGVDVRVETVTGVRLQGRVASVSNERLLLTTRRRLGRERLESLRAIDVRRVVIVRSSRVGGGGGPGARVVLGAVGAALAGVGLARQRGDLLILGLGAGVLAAVPPDAITGLVKE